MTKAQSDRILAAIEAAGIDKYMYTTDIPTHFLNDGKTAFTIADDDGVHAFFKNGFAGAHSYFPNETQICYYFADYGDIHEFKTAGTKDQMLAFINALGLSITDDQVKILKWMDAVRNDLKPITGDYKFKKLSDEEYNKLTPEEKEKYDAAKKQYELEKAGISGKASISVQVG